MWCLWCISVEGRKHIYQTSHYGVRRERYIFCSMFLFQFLREGRSEDQAHLAVLEFKLGWFSFCSLPWACQALGKRRGNCSVVQNLLHVGHCLLIAVANALHHHPFLRVLWLGHISSRSLIRSWLVIRDWKRFCDDTAPNLRSSWIWPRVGVLSWHSNSSCSLLVVLFLVPTKFFCFCLAVLVQLGIYLSGLCPILPCVPIVFLLQRVARDSRSGWSFSVKVHLSFGAWSLSSPLLATLPLMFFGKGGGRDVITSYHHCWVKG